VLTLYDSVNLPGCFHAWLCSSEADFLKGRYVWVNWDVDELKADAAKIAESSFFTITLDGWSSFASLQ
jgi:hypothetical protein